MMAGPAKPATVRFYFDADVLGSAKTVVTLRSDVTYPGDPGGGGDPGPRSPIRPRSLDGCSIAVSVASS